MGSESVGAAIAIMKQMPNNTYNSASVEEAKSR